MSEEKKVPDTSSGYHYRLTTDNTFNIVDQSRSVVTLRTDGSVEFGPDMTPDEAARQFWVFLAQTNPLRAEVERLRAENAALKQDNTYLEKILASYRSIADRLQAENAALREIAAIFVDSALHYRMTDATAEAWYECPFCGGRQYELRASKYLHADACPVTKARALLGTANGE